MKRATTPRIVITGLGAVTPIGNSVSEFWSAMMAGTSGAAPITRFDATEFETRFACEVKNYDPTQHISRKEVQRMDLFAQFAMSAAVMAVEDSGINFETTNRERVGV
ncbi:MAG TPA: beta-ketoacyl-[acyl-carrier-protein] synthase II, partial [Bacteroidetes bacterium]|nr:beta-ketoacyl-[acyl-carrier-protein] synthase II [Bacteroidota bacterium]